MYMNVLDCFYARLKCFCCLMKVDFHGLDGVGGPLYVGTGCFHRRAILLGKSFSDRSTTDWKIENDNDGRDIKNIESLASCTFESDTQWGKEVLYLCYFSFWVPFHYINLYV